MAAPKRCHYEVLELPRTATFDEVKAAYRRLALVHHPDKNGGSVESTERFRIIQTACKNPVKQRPAPRPRLPYSRPAPQTPF